MAKGNCMSSFISDKAVDKIIAFAGKYADKGIEMSEKSDEKEGTVFYAKEVERLRKEFNRIMDTLENTDPTSEEYYRVSKNLYELKSIMPKWGY